MHVLGLIGDLSGRAGLLGGSGLTCSGVWDFVALLRTRDIVTGPGTTTSVILAPGYSGLIIIDRLAVDSRCSLIVGNVVCMTIVIVADLIVNVLYILAVVSRVEGEMGHLVNHLILFILRVLLLRTGRKSRM